MKALALALGLLAATSASADPRPRTPTDPAEVAYKEGRRHYDLREWDEAIASFKESYRLRGDERSLFNIAQAYRLKGDCVEAQGFYQTYKRNFPDADGIPAVERLLIEIQPCVRDHAAPVVVTPPPTPTPTPEPTPTPAPSPRAPRGALRLTGLAVGGVGVAAVAAGIWFGLSAQDKANSVSTGSGVFDHGLESDGKAAAQDAELLWIAGGALVATGVVLYVIGRSGGAAEHLAIVPTSRGGSLTWRASF